MKKFALILLLSFAAIFFFSQQTFAQRYDEAQYNYADVKTGIIYQLYLKFNGYQVQVWMKNNRATEWSVCTVTGSNDDVITVKLGTTVYNLKLDPYNEDVIVVHNANYTQKWKYLKQ